MRGGLSGSYSHNFNIEIRPLNSGASKPWGAFSGIMMGKSVSWEVGLGGLRNGSTAGSIMFKELDLSGNQAVRDRLYYTPPVNYLQIYVVKDGPSGQRLRQIAVPSGYIDLVDVTDGYEIRFYSPSQGSWSSSIYTFTGSPWKTISVVSTLAAQLLVTETEGAESRVSEITETGYVATG
nr:hypothetical protein [Opitutaceae bacterium]